MAQLKNILVLLILSTSLVAQPLDDTKPGNYLWGDLGVAVSDFDGGSLSPSLSLNLAVDHHLYSIHTQTYLNNISFFCESARPILEHYQILYGYIRKRKDNFQYLKGGPAFANYSFVTDTIPGTASFSCNEYAYSSRWKPGIALEAGAAFTFNWFSSQVYASILLVGEPGPVVQAGLKFGFGDFR